MKERIAARTRVPFCRPAPLSCRLSPPPLPLAPQADPTLGRRESMTSASSISDLPRLMVDHRDLLAQFTRRGVAERYRSSSLGFIWALLTPLAMLATYTFVFAVIFKARWSQSDSGGLADFALPLFTGLIAFSVFSEPVVASPGLMMRYPNFIKKVVFPLEILDASLVGAAIVHSLMSLVIVLIGTLIFQHTIQWTIVYLPLYYLPLAMLTVGTCWLLSALGVYLRDIAQLIGLLVQLLMFLTPIFYPIDIVPQRLRWLFLFNPLYVIVDGFRRAILWGQPPDWIPLVGVWIASLAAMALGFFAFVRLKKGFADVM